MAMRPRPQLVRQLGDTVITVAVSLDESIFAAGAANKRVTVVSTSSGEELAQFTCAAGVNAVTFAGCSPTHMVRVASGERMSEAAIAEEGRLKLAPMLAAGTFGGTVRAAERRTASASR